MTVEMSAAALADKIERQISLYEKLGDFRLTLGPDAARALVLMLRKVEEMVAELGRLQNLNQERLLKEARAH